MDRFRGLKIGVQAWTFRKFELPDMVSAVAELGLRYLEPGYLGEGGLHPDNPDRTALAAELCRKNDIHAESFNAKFPPEADADVQRPAFELRDMDPDKDPVKGDGGNYMEYIVGEGPLDLKGLLKLLLDWEYQGTICLEYKPNADDPSSDLRAALGHIEEALTQI